MNIQHRIALHRLLFASLCLFVIILLAVLSQRYPLTFDWTQANRNSLRAESRAILDALPGAIKMTGFITGDNTLRGAMQQLVGRYQRHRHDVQLELIDPQQQPALAEQFEVTRQGELVIDYQGRRQHVQQLSEAAVSTALSHLARPSDRWIAYLDGYGKRLFQGKKRTDFQQLSIHLESLGLKLRPLILSGKAILPGNISLLVIPHLDKTLPPQAARLINLYLQQGGNLLWFADPGSEGRAGSVADALGIHIEAGLLIDPANRIAGKRAPEFIQVKGFAEHPISAGLNGPVVFPTAASLSWQAPAGWHTHGIASSPLRSWRETGDIMSTVRFDAGQDSPGPADITVAMQRPKPQNKGEQRVVVIGDSDFISNAYLGLGANRTFATNIFNWLSADDALTGLSAIGAADLEFNPTPLNKAVIALGAPIALPLVLFGIGIFHWHRRRRR